MKGWPTPVRLAAAALLSLLPLGLVWSRTPYTLPGTTVSGYCPDDGVCAPDTYVPGASGTTRELVAQSPARVFLVAAAVLLLWAARRPRTAATLRLARLAALALAITAVLAAGQRAPGVLLCCAAALAVLPAAVRGPLPRNRGVLEKAHRSA